MGSDINFHLKPSSMNENIFLLLWTLTYFMLLPLEYLLTTNGDKVVK